MHILGSSHPVMFLVSFGNHHGTLVPRSIHIVLPHFPFVPYQGKYSPCKLRTCLHIGRSGPQSPLPLLPSFPLQNFDSHLARIWTNSLDISPCTSAEK